MAVTVRDIVGDAFRKIGVVSSDEPMTADQAEVGMRALNRMLKSWQNRGFNLWTLTTMTVPLTTAATYTLAVRPMEIDTILLRRGLIDLQMQPLTRQEYDTLPLKSSTGVPTSWYFNRQRAAATVTVWPVLAVAGGESLVITYRRAFEDAASLDDEPDVPDEWLDAVVYNLGARLTDDFTVSTAQNVIARAEIELRQALAFDREGSYFFGEC